MQPGGCNKSEAREEPPMKKSIALIALLMLLCSATFPQGNMLDKKTKDALKELYKGIRDFAQENIIPQMKQWKATLDQSMSQDDLAGLNALRDRASRVKADGIRLRLALRNAVETGNAVEKAGVQEKINALAADRKALLADFKPLGVKYKSKLESIGKESKPLAKEWKAGIKNIGVSWYAAQKDDLSIGFKAALGKGIERLKMLGAMMGGEMKGKLAAAKFMLWDGGDLPKTSPLLNDDASGPSESENVTPEGYALETNYPNPFNPSTKISFTLPKADHVTLVVYDLLGKEITTLVDGELASGAHTVTFDGKNLASGTYIYRIRAGDFVQEKTMQLIK
jgi:hypothetical protein